MATCDISISEERSISTFTSLMPEDGSSVFALKLLLASGNPDDHSMKISCVSHVTYVGNMSTCHLQNIDADKRIMLK
jgi:hypothetical protein